MTLVILLEGGGVPHWGLACRQKGPARATKYFSGNGVAVASMCAVRHQYRPVAANEVGGSGPAIDPDFDPQVSTVVSTASTKVPNGKSPTSVLALFGMGARK